MKVYDTQGGIVYDDLVVPMEQTIPPITIFSKSGQKLLEVQVDDDSYRYRSLSGSSTLKLMYSLPVHVDLPIGSYVDYQGDRYTLWLPENFKKEGNRIFDYTVEFSGIQEMLKKFKFKLLSSKPYDLKFTFTAKPRDFLQMLVDNLNLYDSGWTVGKCIDAPEKVLSFNHENCYTVVYRFAQEYDTEVEFVGKTINFCKTEYNKDAPLALSFGKGNGFKSGIGRQNDGDKRPITILYAVGGEKNIDFSTYNSKSLLLPKSQELEFEGKRYKTNEDGTFIMRADKELTDIEEDSLDATSIYPKRVGAISKVEVTKDGFYDIFDVSVPEELDFSKSRLKGEKATIIFQSGNLAGREFDIVQTEDALTGYVHAERRFKLVSTEEGGVTFPNAVLCPKVGDTYAVFHIKLPDAYICNNSDQSGASWDMFREGVRYFSKRDSFQFSFKGELNEIWAKQNWLEVGGKIKPGSYVEFSDTHFQPDGILIRMTGVKDYTNTPESPTIELSNAPSPGSLSDELGKIDSNEVVNEDRYKDALSFTARRWLDAIGMQNMMEKAFKDYGKGQSMSWLRTLSVLVGHESLQFRFVDRIATTLNQTVNEIDHRFDYDNTTKVFTTSAGIIQHMTLGIDSLSPSHKGTEYKFWSITGYTSPPIDETSPLYLYLKCSKSNQTGSFWFSKEPKDMDNADGYYYFLTGALSDEVDGQRSFATVYGFSEIGPGWMRLNKIISLDGTQYWDMLSKAFRIGDDNSYLAYSTAAGMILRGCMYQSPSGTVDYPEVDRGSYSYGTKYYPGDKVAYNGNIYKCTTETTGTQYPSNSNYWKQLVSKGDKGDKGDIGNTGATGGTGPVGPQGPQGYIGPSGPAPIYRGDYNSSTKYTATSKRVDIVYYPSTGKYYVGRFDNGEATDFVGIAPTNTSYWTEFGGQFTSIATGLLLASWANIAGFIFNDEKMYSQDVNHSTGEANLMLDGRTGEIRAMKGVFGGYLKLPFVNIGNSDATYTNGEYLLRDNLNITTSMNKIILPTDNKYAGAIVSIYNNAWPPYTKSFTGTYVRTYNWQKIFIPRTYAQLASDDDFVESICVSSGVVRLVGVLGQASGSSTQCIRWVVLN